MIDEMQFEFDDFNRVRKSRTITKEQVKKIKEISNYPWEINRTKKIIKPFDSIYRDEPYRDLVIYRDPLTGESSTSIFKRKKPKYDSYWKLIKRV